MEGKTRLCMRQGQGRQARSDQPHTYLSPERIRVERRTRPQARSEKEVTADAIGIVWEVGGGGG